jgi:hypothetical protein
MDKLAFIGEDEIVLTIENNTSFLKILQDNFHFA